MIDLSPSQAAPLIATLLGSPESRSLEFKRVSGQMIHKALETLCAFANTEGGALALGIEDPARLKAPRGYSAFRKTPKRWTSCSARCAHSSTRPSTAFASCACRARCARARPGMW